MTTLPTPLGQQVNTILAVDTPLLISRPSGLTRIKTVRGGLGTPQNQDDPGSSQLSYANEPLSGAQQDQTLVFVQETGDARILKGNKVNQTFVGTTDVDPATDQITVTGHGYVTGDGPYHITVAKTDLVPAGINVTAVGILTFGANPLDLEVVTIDGKVYTFDLTVLDNINGHVLIGATASDSLDNLIAAITLGAGSGTLYAAATTLHPTVTAVAGTGDTMDASAKAFGTVGNVLATTTDVTSGSWADTTLLGGVDTDYFIIRVDDDDFQVALTRQDAQDDTQVDITADGSGTNTIGGTFNISFAPAASIQDGSSGILLAAGQSLILPADETVTLVGDTGAVTSFFYP